jgi:ubiquinone biosynthesis monooxygenase Coq7
MEPRAPMTRAPLPGDAGAARRLAEMIRVDHAGEYGAARIYAGQLAVLGGSSKAAIIRHMLAQEQAHLATFNAMGARAAMACTVAVEETIDAHYAEQAAALSEQETELAATIERFRLEELEHRDIGLDHEAERTPFYRALTGVIKAGCRIAIAVSEKI